MKRPLSLALLAFLLLSGCGNSTDSAVKTDGSLSTMVQSDPQGTSDVTNPEDVPYSEGPSSIPSDLVPNE